MSDRPISRMRRGALIAALLPYGVELGVTERSVALCDVPTLRHWLRTLRRNYGKVPQ